MIDRNRLTNSDIDEFAKSGFCLKEDAISEETLNRVRRSLSDTFIKLSKYREFTDKEITALENTKFERQFLNMCYVDSYFHTIRGKKRLFRTPAVFDLMRSKEILGLIRPLIGGDILFHPSYNIHARLPGESTVAHQDLAYYLPEADSANIVICIVPLVDTTIDNGCVWVASGSHKKGVLTHDFDGKSLYVPDRLVPESKKEYIELTAGSILLMDSFLVHGSGINSSDIVRWSMDFRYQPADLPTGRWYAPGFIAESQSGTYVVEDNLQVWVDREKTWEAKFKKEDARPRYRWDHLGSSKPSNVNDGALKS